MKKLIHIVKSISVSYLFIIFYTFSTPDLIAQTDSSFTPHGRPFALIFTNLHYSFSKEGNTGAFELTRAYLGYEYFFSKTISSRLNIDVGDPGVGEFQMTAFIKNAFVQYKGNSFSARVGMINVDQFALQEEHWGYRYHFKSFQDAYKFGPAADLGVALDYSPSKIISFDFSVLNGEGYKKVQIDSIFKTTAGFTLRPVNGLILRGYFDRMKKEHAQTSLAFFAG
jgi:hypothetical protein